MTDEKQKFLDETNALLKKVWSHDRIESDTEKTDTLEYKLNHLFDTTKKPEPKPGIIAPIEKEKKDTNSFIYFKNKRELDIYKKKLNWVEIDIIKNIMLFQFSQIKKLLLKKKLLSQNIEIIDNRINNRVISYTKVLHGIEYHINKFFQVINMVASILFYIIFLYTITYIILQTLSSINVISSQFQWKALLFITLFTLTAFFVSYIRWLKSSIVVLPILLFVLYFLSVNF
jgi:hypothetical protein